MNTTNHIRHSAAPPDKLSQLRLFTFVLVPPETKHSISTGKVVTVQRFETVYSYLESLELISLSPFLLTSPLSTSPVSSARRRNYPTEQTPPPIMNDENMVIPAGCKVAYGVIRLTIRRYIRRRLHALAFPEV